MIRVKNLSYSYKVNLLNYLLKKPCNMDFYIDELEILEGERVALIGFNGSGKSTFLKLLIGILKPYGGELSVSGILPYNQRQKHVKNIGVVWGNRSTLWWDLTAMENFRALKDIYKIDKNKFKYNIKFFTTSFDCEDILNKQIRKLSLGQRMKIEIIAALLHSPKLLIFDEPFLGLDFMSKEKIYLGLSQYLDNSNGTLILTSHDLNDLSILCNEMILLNNGELIIKDNTDKLIKYNLLSYEILIEQNDIINLNRIQQWINSSKIDIIHTNSLNSVRLKVDSEITPVEVLKRLIENNQRLETFTVIQNDLENLIKILVEKCKGEMYSEEKLQLIKTRNNIPM